MIAPGTFAKQPTVVLRASERRTLAFMHELADTCRTWPELADWLSDEFARNPKTRENFRALVAAPAVPASLAEDAFAMIAGEGRASGKEKARITEELGGDGARLWGGRTWTEMEQIVRRYEAGTLDLGVFTLVRNWRKAGARAKGMPELRRAALEIMDAVICDGNSHLWANVSSSLALLTRMNNTNLRGAFGHSDWWKLHALLYMMRHPRPAYRTREVRAHLAKLGLPIGTLDFRRFCNRHGIARDERAGRPRYREKVRAVAK